MENEPKVVRETYKVWLTIEKHVEYDDGMDDYENIDDETVSAGEFDTYKEAVEKMNEISDYYRGDYTTK